MPRDLYADLGVSSTADAATIKAAYRTRAKQHHPDSNPGDPAAPARFRVVAEAYAVLSDPVKRGAYDLARRGGSVKLDDFWRDQFPGMVTDIVPHVVELRSAIRTRNWGGILMSGWETIRSLQGAAATAAAARRARKERL